MNSKLHILYAAVFWCVLFVGSCITTTATLSLHIFWGAFVYVIYFHGVTIEGK
jgi:hypothetical protein